MNDKLQEAINALRAAGNEAGAKAVEELRDTLNRTMEQYHAGQRASYESGRKDEAESHSRAARDVLAERERQQSAEGWTPEHDDEHDTSELAKAAACYALSAAGVQGDDSAQLRFWPWSDSSWRPTNPRRDLVKAAALILAEIERLDRRTPTPD